VAVIITCVVNIIIAKLKQREIDRRRSIEEESAKAEQDKQELEIRIKDNELILVAEMRFRFNTLPNNPRLRPKTYPSDQCLFPYEIDSVVDLLTGEVQDDRLPHIKECLYCKSRLMDADCNRYADFWRKVFERELN